MINKIKDFLKNKRPRRGMKDSSTQEEFSDNSRLSDDDQTGEFKTPQLKNNFKDNLALKLHELKNKFQKVKGKEWKTSQPGAPKKTDSTSLLSPSLSRSIEKILSREGRETIHQVGMVIIVCGITYTLGKMTALILRGAPTLDTAHDYSVSIDLDRDFKINTLAQVKNINIFRTNTGLGEGTKKVASNRCDKAQQTSNLPIKLINTIVLQDSVKSLASVQVRGGRDLEEFREGDQISNIAKVAKITRLEILIKNLENGVCESIASDKAKESKSPISVMTPGQTRTYLKNKKISGIDNVGNKFIIQKKLLDEKLKDIAGILTQARAIKIQNPDGSLSFKLTEMDPEGLFPYLGLQDQDIITSINGKPIYDMNEVMSLFSKIKNLDNLSLGIKREGSDSNQEYSIKK